MRHVHRQRQCWTTGVMGALWLVALAVAAAGHGTGYEPLADAYAGPIPATGSGARAFFAQVQQHPSGLWNAADHQLLHAIEHGYQVADQVAAREIDAPAREAAAQRRRAEERLVELIGRAPDLVMIDSAVGASGSTDRPRCLPAGNPCLLLRVGGGSEPWSFRVQRINLQTAMEPAPLPIALAPTGTTFVLLEFDEVPAGLSYHNLAFAPDGAVEPVAWHALALQAPPQGQLHCVVRDETGAVTPALVRLTSVASGRVVAPAGAVDFAPLMTDLVPPPQHGHDTFYCYNLGPSQGPFWVVEGGFDMALPAGAWQIDIYRGLEYESLRTEVDVRPGQAARCTCTLRRWTDMAARGWYSGDDHVHARLMHDVDARALLALARATDTHVFNILEMGNAMRTWFTQRGFGPDFRVRQGDYVLVPGQEDPRSQMGHSIGLNLTALARDLDHYLLNDWVADTIHAQGGLYGHTHVGEKAFDVHRDMTMLVCRQKSDFASILQIHLGTEHYYDFLDLGYRLTASAGTDVPYGWALGMVRVYAYLGPDTPFTADAWFDAFARGRTFVTHGPMLELRVEDAGPGDEIELAAPRPLRVQARAWGWSAVTAPRRLRLVMLSDPVAEAVSSDSTQSELTLDTTLECPFGGWVAAHVVAHNGSQAHTTPVYVRREGFRPWNATRAATLLDERLATLDEIEAMVAEAESHWVDGRGAPVDFWYRWPADQADVLRERVAEVRAIYTGLQQTLAEERPRRHPR